MKATPLHSRSLLILALAIVLISLSLRSFADEVAPAESEPITPAAMLCRGAWAIGAVHDPFNVGNPVVSYLPPGTIVFNYSKASRLQGYLEVQTHYRHPLLIKSESPSPWACTPKAPNSILRSSQGLLGALPIDKVILHENLSRLFR